MSTQTSIKGNKINTDIIRIELSDWLYNAGIVGLLKILSFDKTEDEINELFNLEDSHFVDVKLSAFKDFPINYLKLATIQYNRLQGLINSLNNILQQLNKDNLDEESKNKIKNNFKKTWIQSGLDRYGLLTDENNEDELNSIKKYIEKCIKNLKTKWTDQQVLEKDAKTLLGNLGAWTSKSQRKSGFLHSNIVRTLINHESLKDLTTYLQKKEYNNDKNIETFGKGRNKSKLNCIKCNNYFSNKKKSFNTGLVSFAGLNADNVNYIWGFKKELPICSICQLIYLCCFAGFTRGIQKTNFYFVNDDSSLKSLFNKNILLQQLLKKDKEENILINYFHELILQEEQIKSKYTLQNITLVDIDLKKEVMPKVLSLNISRNQAEFIKTNHEQLKWLSTKYYKIKDDYINLLNEFFKSLLSNKLNFRMINYLLKFYIQSKDETKNFVQTNYTPANLQQLTILTSNYFKIVKQKSIDMETKHIWYVYHIGNDMQSELAKRDAKNKINGIAYRLLNAVRANDKSTFLNVLLRLYIGYDKEVPKTLVNTLESEETFQVIGHSFINGLLGEIIEKKS